MSAAVAAFTRMMKHPIKFRMFLLTKLPSAYFTGVRIKDADAKKCVTTVPYKWFSKNPFRSTYFASLAMAAEMSTGALALAHLYKRRPSVSMLLVKLEAEYYKKATDKTTFVCEDGELFQIAIEQTITSGEARTVTAKSIGTNIAGETVAQFFVTWSFKARQRE
jgi:hypothetical protein